MDYRELLHDAARDMPPTTVMEVCGTHTNAIAKYAIRQVLPDNMELISGPGCPVCVTDGADIEAAVFLAKKPDTVLYSFGDMLRVPSLKGKSLNDLREAGADVRIALSPTDALDAAMDEPEKQIIWFAVGFETTAPLTAAMLAMAKKKGVRNLSVLCAHKTMPAALKALLSGSDRVHALLCPGHVAVITGSEEFSFIPETLGLPAAISGFEPEEIIVSLAEIAKLRARGEAKLKNCYRSVVTSDGNIVAKGLIRKTFTPCRATWRGLGDIDNSGLCLSEAFRNFDARERFAVPTFAASGERNGCICSKLLRGEAKPLDCALFGKACTPEQPMGPCMVAFEGACAAAFRYGG